jgi:hypothetical protein
VLGAGCSGALDSVSSWRIPLRSVSCPISPATLNLGCLRASRDYVNSGQGSIFAAPYVTTVGSMRSEIETLVQLLARSVYDRWKSGQPMPEPKLAVPPQPPKQLPVEQKVE